MISEYGMGKKTKIKACGIDLRIGQVIDKNIEISISRKTFINIITRKDGNEKRNLA